MHRGWWVHLRPLLLSHESVLTRLRAREEAVSRARAPVAARAWGDAAGSASHTAAAAKQRQRWAALAADAFPCVRRTPQPSALLRDLS
jgi:hypothetical protein